MNEKTPENPDKSKNRDAIEKLKKKAKNLIEKIKQQELLAAEDNIGDIAKNYESPFKRIDYFKFHHFLSLSKIKNIPYKEWLGETLNDETVIINYRNGSVIVGAGFNEIKARQNMELICETRNQSGVLVHHGNITINDINDMVKLEWKIPDSYIEE